MPQIGEWDKNTGISFLRKNVPFDKEPRNIFGSFFGIKSDRFSEQVTSDNGFYVSKMNICSFFFDFNVIQDGDEVESFQLFRR